MTLYRYLCAASELWHGGIVFLDVAAKNGTFAIITRVLIDHTPLHTVWWYTTVHEIQTLAWDEIGSAAIPSLAQNLFGIFALHLQNLHEFLVLLIMLGLVELG